MVKSLSAIFFGAFTFIAGFGTLNNISNNSTSTTISLSPTLSIPKNLTVNNVTPAYKATELDLSSDRVVYIYGVIDEFNSPQIAKQILELGKDKRPINVLINSPGGSVFDGALIIAAMEAASGPVNTVCVQLCASMAAMIHQYGTHRYMLDKSILMFHPATGGVEGEVDKSYSRLSTIKEYIGKLEKNVARRSNMTYEAYKAKAEVEWWSDAEDSVTSRLSDGTVFVRGSAAGKIFSPPPSDNHLRKVLPFQVPNKLRVMWF